MTAWNRPVVPARQAGAASSGTAGGGRSLLRRINAAAALRRLRAGPATVAQVSDAVGVSRTASQQILDQLVQLRWVAEDPRPDIAPPRIGPAPRHYRFRGEAGYVAGVDIGRHRVTALLADLAGGIVARTHLVVGADASADDRLAAVGSVVDTCLGEARVKPAQLWTLGVGTRGVVHEGRVGYVGGLPGWTGLDLAGLVSRLFDRPVVVDNDCNLAAIAEHWIGAATDVDDVVCVQVGKSIGAGIMIGGRLHRGVGGYAGELHHLPFLGWRGAAAQLKTDDGEQADQDAAFAAAADGDPVATAAVDRYTRVLSEGIAAITAVVDPELVVLGGAVSASGATLLEPVRRHLSELTVRTPRIELSPLEADAVALGAVRAGLDQVDASIARATDERGSLPPPRRRVIQSHVKTLSSR